jgi:broad specificity phosphatase PhoE
MATRLILVRHGETDWNIAHRYQGHSDTELNETGRTQAQLLAQKLKDEPINAIYCSDLSRAYQTAIVIADERNIPVYPTSQLRECSFGIWEGKTFKEVLAQFPEEIERIQQDPLTAVRTGGESREQMFTRVSQEIQWIVKQNPNRTVLVVAHEGSIAAAMGYITGEGMAARSKYRLDNASYHIVEERDGQWHIIQLGSLSRYINTT